MKISVLDQTHLQKGITVEQGFSQSISLAQYLDELGYERYWLSEHHNSDALSGSSPEILASFLLAKTKRIKVGSGGVMLPHYSAYKVAENFKVMSALAPKRVDLGIGRAPGGYQLSTIALAGQQKKDFPEQTEELLQYLANDIPLQNPLRGLQATPLVQQPPTVWILGTGPSSALIAAHLGLPYAFALFINPTLEIFEESFQLYHKHFTPSQYLAKPYVMLAMNVIGAENDREAQYLMKSALEFDYHKYNGELTRLIDPKQATELADKKLRDSIVKNYIIGSKDSMVQQLNAFTEKFPIDELMAITRIFDFEKRQCSFKILKEASLELKVGA